MEFLDHFMHYHLQDNPANVGLQTCRGVERKWRAGKGGPEKNNGRKMQD